MSDLAEVFLEEAKQHIDNAKKIIEELENGKRIR